MISNLFKEPADFSLIFEGVTHTHKKLNGAYSVSEFTKQLKSCLFALGLDVSLVTKRILVINRTYILICDSDLSLADFRQKIRLFDIQTITAAFLLKLPDLNWRRLQIRFQETEVNDDHDCNC